MNRPTPEVFTSAFVLPSEVVAMGRERIPHAEDGLRRLDDLMVVLEGLGGPLPPQLEFFTWSIVRL